MAFPRDATGPNLGQSRMNTSPKRGANMPFEVGKVNTMARPSQTIYQGLENCTTEHEKPSKLACLETRIWHQSATPQALRVLIDLLRYPDKCFFSVKANAGRPCIGLYMLNVSKRFAQAVRKIKKHNSCQKNAFLRLTPACRSSYKAHRTRTDVIPRLKRGSVLVPMARQELIRFRFKTIRHFLSAVWALNLRGYKFCY